MPVTRRGRLHVGRRERVREPRGECGAVGSAGHVTLGNGQRVTHRRRGRAA